MTIVSTVQDMKLSIQARLEAVSGKRMNRRNELIEGRRQWLHQTLDSLSPEEKQATGLMSPVKQKGKIHKVWGADSLSMWDNGSMVFCEFERGHASVQEWVASQDRRN